MKIIIIYSIFFITLFSVVGCTTHRPTINTSGVDPQKYEADLKECQEYSKKFMLNKSQMAVSVLGGGIGAYAAQELADPEQKEAVKLHGRVTSAQYIENCIKAKGYSIIPDQEPKKDE